LDSSKILDQIETSADYYGPDIYAKLLGFYSSLTLKEDSLSYDFIPVSGVKSNPKLFVVGLIPPAANVSGKLLDRSASVASVLGAPEDLATEVAAKKGAPGAGVKAPPMGNGSAGASLPDSFWDSYARMCNRIGADPYALAAVIQRESGFRPDAQNKVAGKDKPPVAQGLHQMVWSTAKNYMSKEQWDNLANTSAESQLEYVEKYFRGRARGKNAAQLYAMNLGGYPNPDGSAYASKAAQAEWIAAHPGDAGKFKNPDYQDLAVKQNPGIGDGQKIFSSDLAKFVEGGPPAVLRTKIDEALKRVGIDKGSLEAPPVEISSGDWKDKGSSNASEFNKLQAKLQDNSLARDNLGQRFLQAQQAEIDVTRQALDNMRNTPPLRLLVNPASFKVSSEKIASDGNWTRDGAVIEFWGDNQDKLEASGRVAGFFAIDSNPPEEDSEGGPGLTRVARNFSAAYHNLLSLWLLYRNNAGLYLEGLDGTERARLSMVGSVYIFYDDILYLGSFDSFNLTESDDKPFSLEYNFEFTVRSTFILDRPDDPRISSMTASGSTPMGNQTLFPPTGGEVRLPETGFQEMIPDNEVRRLFPDPRGLSGETLSLETGVQKDAVAPRPAKGARK